MRRRTHAGKIESLGDVLGKILKKRKIFLNLPLDRSLNPEDKRITAAWNKAVGARIVAHASPDKLQRGTLFVKVSDSVWMQQLHFLKQDILGKINPLPDGTTVKNIHFSLGKTPVSPTGDKLPPAASSSLKARDRKMIDENTAAIIDPELRDILKKVMTREITRRRLREER